MDVNDPLRIIENDVVQSRPERADAAANRRRILETAEDLFNKNGVGNVNMADIAQAAGVGKGTLYRRFASKGELCLMLMDTQMRQFQERTLARMRQLTEEEASQLEQLNYFLDELVYFVAEHSPLLCVVQHEGLLERGEHASLPHYWQYMTIHGLLRSAVNTGELPSHLDTEYLADALLAVVKPDFFSFQRGVRGYSLERISRGLQMLVASFSSK